MCVEELRPEQHFDYCGLAEGECELARVVVAESGPVFGGAVACEGADVGSEVSDVFAALGGWWGHGGRSVLFAKRQAEFGKVVIFDFV